MPRSRLVALTVAGVLVGAASTAPLEAQGIELSVKVAVSPDLARQIQQALDDTLPLVRADLANAVRDLRTDLGDRAVTSHDGSRPGGGQATQTDVQTRPLALGPSGSLDLMTFAGNITVTVGTGAPTLQITRKARGRTDADARAALDRVTIDQQERAGRVVVRTLYPSRSNGINTDVEVSYAVSAPAGVSVRAQTYSGDIAMTGMHGEVSANTTSGSVTLTDVRKVTGAHTTDGTVTIADTQADEPLGLDSIAGNLVLRSVKAPRVTASTISGNVQAESLDCREATLKTLSGNVEYHGTLARGGRYELHTHSGEVRFEPVGSTGFDLDAQTFNGTVTISPALHLHLAGTQHRTVTGTVGDGAATVTIVTFNGNVLVGPR